MQTFHPYLSYTKSARCLDRLRLGKQRIEVVQMLRALRGETKGWVNHPVTKRWTGFESALGLYGMLVCTEWIRRGYIDNQYRKMYELVKGLSRADTPPWLTPEFCKEHQALLIKKNPDYYTPIFERDPEP